MKAIVKMVLVLISLGIITACNKQNESSSLKVRMTDAPGDFQQVNVDLQGLEIHYENEENGTEGWVTLPVKAGIYDLLTLQNNVSVIIADESQIPPGFVNQIRMILGTNNSIMVDGLILDLKTPSAQQSGLKINVNHSFQSQKEYELLLDFDAGKSIVLEGNGTYSLKPLIQIKSVIQVN